MVPQAPLGLPPLRCKAPWCRPKLVRPACRVPPIPPPCHFTIGMTLPCTAPGAAAVAAAHHPRMCARSPICEPRPLEHLHESVLIVKGHLWDVVLEVGLDLVNHRALLRGGYLCGRVGVGGGWG
jgi:hypothetical protein